MKRTPAFALCAAVAMFSCLQAAADEPTNAPSANPAAPPTVAPSTATTNAPAPATPPPAENAANETQLPEISIYGRLDQARNQILPSLGATSYSINESQLDQMPQGENAPMNQVLLRAPGVAEDSFGGLHVRGEHANLQYRINGVIIPEGITLFGQELDARFVESMALTTGSLPAEYGYRTAGIVDITTKTGIIEPGGEVGIAARHLGHGAAVSRVRRLRRKMDVLPGCQLRSERQRDREPHGHRGRRPR